MGFLQQVHGELDLVPGEAVEKGEIGVYQRPCRCEIAVARVLDSRGLQFSGLLGGTIGLGSSADTEKVELLRCDCLLYTSDAADD